MCLTNVTPGSLKNIVYMSSSLDLLVRVMARAAPRPSRRSGYTGRASPGRRGSSSGSISLALIGLATVPVLAGCGGDEPTHDPAAKLQSECTPGERLVGGKRCVPAGVQDNGCPAGTIGLED